MPRKKNPSAKKLPPKATSSVENKTPMVDPGTLKTLPVSYQEISDFFSRYGEINPFLLRVETFKRIESITGIPLVCYTSKVRNLPQGGKRPPTHIDDGDLTGISDLVHSVNGDAIDVLIISNGGSAEVAERIVRLIRDRFKVVRFIVPSNAYSAATLICFSGDTILMDSLGTLGPIDPQINGIPARAIKRAFEKVEERLKVEGPKALTAYMPLINKYDLHTLEICTSAEDLSEELAKNWLSEYMLKCDPTDQRVTDIVDHFKNYDLHKSHARSIDRRISQTLGIEVEDIEKTEGLLDLTRSLNNQYDIWYDKTPFYKMYENAHGINWGRKQEEIVVNIPMPGSFVQQPS